MRFRAKGRVRVPGAMNKTEAAYAGLLTQWQADGMVAWFAFEGVKLKLADKTFYTPDFAVMMGNGQLEMHEVKGFWEDDARVKIKVAAVLFPFQFVAVSKDKAMGWKEERF